MIDRIKLIEVVGKGRGLALCNEEIADQILQLIEQSVQKEEEKIYSIREMGWWPVDENGNRKKVIYSVKRLSDGEVFHIGDKVATIYNTLSIKPMVITKIEIDDKVSGGIALIGDNNVTTAITIVKHYLEPVQEVKKVLLVTEDGVDVTDEHQLLYGVCKEDWDLGRDNSLAAADNDLFWWFSSEEARTEWVEYNKPCLSQKEVNEIVVEAQRKSYLEGPITESYKESIKCALDTYVMDKLRENK